MRRLQALVRGLPETSALYRAVAGPKHGWGNTEELLAINAELTYAVHSLLVRVHSKKGTKPPKSLRIPRPGDHVEERRAPTRQDFRNALLGG